MLTLFTCPKSFSNSKHIDLIQRNALQSWKRLKPQPQIILLGNDEGVAEVAAEMGLEHVPDIERNEYGTPLISDIFAQAKKHATEDILCYINADIILNIDFMQALETAIAQKNDFLLVSQRWNVDIDEPINFNAPQWEKQWTEWVEKHGIIAGETAIDFFAYPKHLYQTIPAFAIGRTIWDNWLLFEARRLKARLIDATPVVFLAHQNHDYAHVTSSAGDAWKGPERNRNFELSGGYEHIYTIANSTHRIIKGANGLKLEKISKTKSLGQKIHELSTTNAIFRPLGKVARAIKLARLRGQSHN